MEKVSFLFYKDWVAVLKELTDKERLQAFDAIIAYAFEDEEPQDRTTRIATSLMRSQIARDNEKWENTRSARSIAGKKGMASRYDKSQQSVTNVTNTTSTTVNVEDNVKGKEKGNIDVTVDVDVEKDKAIAYPYDAVVRLWNELCMPLPQVKKLNDSRRKKIKCRLVEFSQDSNEWLPKTRELFERVMSSDFLRGEKSDWQATFDWLFDNPKNWVKVMEGNYDNERKRTTVQHHPNLGVGEYIAQDGTRRYGTGTLPAVPFDAPPRPDDDCYFSAETKTWIPSGV